MQRRAGRAIARAAWNWVVSVVLMWAFPVVTYADHNWCIAATLKQMLNEITKAYLSKHRCCCGRMPHVNLEMSKYSNS